MPVRFFPLYNIDQPVGPGQPNKTDDVRLVQALFIEVSRYDTIDWLPDLPADSRTLATTGVFDDTLALWITTFQKWAVRTWGAANFKADGVIDPMLAMSIAVNPQFKGHHYSTLGYLCNRLWRWNRDAYLRIGDDYRIPWVPTAWPTPTQ